MARYILGSVENMTSTVIRLKLNKTENHKPLVFLPGQYATISYNKGWRATAARCFSLASSPTEQDHLEFGIRVFGKFTQSLISLKPGTIVDVGGPYGNFIFQPDIHHNLVFCAGGIGITPFMSMLRYAAALKLPNNLSLVLSARTVADIPYFEELKQIQSANTNIRIIYVIDNGEIPPGVEKTNIFSGRINRDILLSASKLGMMSTFMLCGPPPFMTVITKTLIDAGVDSASIITEAFSQGQNHKLNDSLDWPQTVYLAGAFGALAVIGLLTTTEILKSLTPSLLPNSLTSDYKTNGTSSRQKDLDKLVNELQVIANSSDVSPFVSSALKEVADAEAKISQLNSGSTASGQQDTNNTVISKPSSSTASTNNSATQTTSSNSSSTPVPVTAPTPTCTTSASGVTTCQ